MKVDIHSVGTVNGHASSRGAGPNELTKTSGLKSQAPPTKAIHANGTVSKAAPAKGKPGASKAFQKRDPAEVQRDRQLADEQNVRSNNPCTSKFCTDAQHRTGQIRNVTLSLSQCRAYSINRSMFACRCAWRSFRSEIGWQMGCGPWQALRQAADPSHLSIWKNS